MADVDFGDSELFEQLDEVKPVQPTHIRFDVTEDSDEEVEALREQLVNCEETIRQLKAENQELRRKLNILTRPSGLSVDDKLDGPLLQILFMNHVISKQFHQEVEDFVTSLAQKFEEQKKSNPEKNPFNIKPQPSSIFLEEKDCINGVDSVKKIKEAFSVVGSVLYFTNFCLDKLGQPLLNENPQLTDGWEIPKYQQMFTQIVSLDGQEIQVKAKRPKPCCFNCGSEEHQMRDCPKPRDNAHINMKRKEFMDACGDSTNQNSQQRYHAEEVEERFGKFKPGFISDELQDALGISDKNLPPFIYRMRQLGYPPGWLKEAELETSGLSLYDGKDSSDGELEEAESKMRNQNVSYDVSKLINYPGFNISTPFGMSDDWRSFGSIPMQSAHQKDTFAGYLTCNFPAQNLQTNQKRLSSSPNDSSDRKKQKLSGYTTAESPVDMDVESDLDTSCSSPSSKGFRFQPPLPPGSPCGTPPPLPRGTPPSTPPNFIPPPPPTPTPPPLPKGTPPLTPTGSSPVPQSKDSYKAMDAMDDDALTLEELEEQQRLIWAALENTESTHSDSPLTGNSVNSSPSRTELNTASVANVPSQNLAKSKKSDVFLEAIAVESDEEHPLTPEAEQSNEEKNNFSATQDDISTIKLSEDKSEDAAEEAVYVDPKNSGIPDMSKFAEGITPFEYDNMSESTGIYLRLRNVLKNSPRNQQKLQKQD